MSSPVPPPDPSRHLGDSRLPIAGNWGTYWRTLPWRSSLLVVLSWLGLLWMLVNWGNELLIGQDSIPGFASLGWALAWGLVLLLTFVAGSIGGHWVVGYRLLLFFTATLLLSVNLIINPGNLLQLFESLLCLPGFCLIAILPYLLPRLFGNWRMLRTAAEPCSIRIEDCFISLAIIASAAGMLRANIAMINREFNEPEITARQLELLSALYFNFATFVIIIPFAGMNLLIMAPMITVFGTGRFRHRLIKAGLASFAISALFSIFLLFVFEVQLVHGGADWNRILGSVWLITLISLYLMVGIELLWLDGFRPYGSTGLFQTYLSLFRRGQSQPRPDERTGQVQFQAQTDLARASEPPTSSLPEIGKSPTLKGNLGGNLAGLDPLGDEPQRSDFGRWKFLQKPEERERYWVRRFAAGLLILAVQLELFVWFSSR
jgi:hypothetical protein